MTESFRPMSREFCYLFLSINFSSRTMKNTCAFVSTDEAELLTVVHRWLSSSYQLTQCDGLVRSRFTSSKAEERFTAWRHRHFGKTLAQAEGWKHGIWTKWISRGTKSRRGPPYWFDNDTRQGMPSGNSYDVKVRSFLCIVLWDLTGEC